MTDGNAGRIFKSPRLSWTVCAFGLKCDENAVRCRIRRWGRDDGTLGHGLHGELATDPAEVVALEKIGFAIFA
jgi:hypothetical protein